MIPGADSELQLTSRVGRRTLSYEDFMSACEAMVALHGALAQQQIRKLPSECCMRVGRLGLGYPFLTHQEHWTKWRGSGSAGLVVGHGGGA